MSRLAGSFLNQVGPLLPWTRRQFATRGEELNTCACFISKRVILPDLNRVEEPSVIFERSNKDSRWNSYIPPATATVGQSASFLKKFLRAMQQREAPIWR